MTVTCTSGNQQFYLYNTSEQSNLNFEAIPLEIIQIIFSQIPEDSFQAMSIVSKGWRRLVKSYTTQKKQDYANKHLSLLFEEPPPQKETLWQVFYHAFRPLTKQYSRGNVIDLLSFTRCFSMMEAFVKSNYWSMLPTKFRIIPLLFVNQKTAEEAIGTYREQGHELECLFNEMLELHLSQNLNLFLNAEHFHIDILERLQLIMSYVLNSENFSSEEVDFERNCLRRVKTHIDSINYRQSVLEYRSLETTMEQLTDLLIGHGASRNRKRRSSFVKTILASIRSICRSSSKN